jgi:dihydroorotase
MYDMIIRAGRLGNGQLVDVAIKHGKIAALGSLPESTEAKQTLTLGGQVHVSAGWIDGHTHCYPASPLYHDEPDKVGVASGVTTVIDAGSTGADDVDDFQRLAATCKTRVHALLNISRIGLLRQNELADPADIDPALAQAAIRRHPGFIVGIKARMSGSVVGESGLQPLRMAKQIQQANGNLPLMVHVGNTPPDLDEIVALLGEGDLLTHCFNGKPNRILTPAGELRQAVREAMRRGLLLDIGHGGASFSFEVAELAIAQGILPHTISSDIYCKNRIKGPVYSLAHVMSKFSRHRHDPGAGARLRHPPGRRCPAPARQGATRGGRRCRHDPVRGELRPHSLYRYRSRRPQRRPATAPSRRPGRRRTGSDSLREITPCLLCMRNIGSNR